MADKVKQKTKIKKGDTVLVIAGRGWATFNREGKRTPVQGKVIEVSPTKGKIKVEGAAIIKRHTRANRAANQPGGIIERENWIDISNVQLIDPATGKPARAGYRIEPDGTRTRVFKSGK